MSSTVQVTFGANIQPLVDGVEDARKAIESFMAAFAADKLADFTEQYAKMGEEIDAAAHQFGASTTQIQQLGYMAKMAGGDQEGLNNSFARLQQTLQQAENPTSRQAMALQALGLSTRQLIGLPLQQQLEVIADSFAKLGDGTNKAAIAQALFRNSSGEMIEILDQGSAGMKAMADQAESDRGGARRHRSRHCRIEGIIVGTGRRARRARLEHAGRTRERTGAGRRQHDQADRGRPARLLHDGRPEAQR